MSRYRQVIAVALMLDGCADAPPPPPQAPPTVASAAPAGPTTISVAAARAPHDLRIDGDLAEWGALPPASPSIALLDLEQPMPGEDPQPLPNPKDAKAHVAVALSPSGLSVAIDLGDAATGDGIWLGVGSRVPALPILGQGAGRVGFLPLQCDFEVECHSVGEGDVCQVSDKANPPEVVAQCQKLLAAYEVLEAGHGKRFAKLFRIDQKGVRRSGDGGSLADVADAKVAWRRGGTGMTAEVSIPLAALPRMADAPVTRLALFASLASATQTPDAAPPTWIGVALPEPVTFEPYGDLRARAFARALEIARRNTQPMQGLYQEPPGLSYQPGDPLHFEGLKTDGDHVSAVTPVEHPLYTRLASMGDVEVGSADLAWVFPSLVVRKAGKQLFVDEARFGMRGAVQRDGELHVVWGSREAWTVRAIGADGKSRDALKPFVPSADRRPARKGDPSAWTDVVEVLGTDLDGFGWRGVKRGSGTEVTWRWDARERMYVGRERHFAPPPKARRR